MKIVVLGHPMVLPENRSRWEKLASFHKDVSVTVLPPKQWVYGNFGKERLLESTSERRGNYSVQPLNFGKLAGKSIYQSLDINLRRLSPDVIWVYSDAGTFLYLQVLLYRKLYAPNAKIVCCTSTNFAPPQNRYDQRWRYQYSLRHTDAFSTGTQEVIDLLHNQGVTAPILHKVVTGADEEIWHPGEEPELKKHLGLSDFVIGFIGKHNEEKGLLDLAETLEGLQGDWSFISLGDGPLKAIVEQRLKAVSGNHPVRMLGYVPRQETAPYYRLMDVIVIPSRPIPNLSGNVFRDPSPVVSMEAGLTGCAIVASDVGGIGELVGQTGFLIEPGNVVALRERLHYVRANPQEMQGLSKKIRKRALEMFSTSVVAHDTYTFLDMLVKEHTRLNRAIE